MTDEQGTLLEVIVSSVDDGVAAEEGGAHRVEVVARLDEDGLTPSRAFVEALLVRVRLPLRVMVRPENVFTVTDRGARQAILADARQWADLPIDGVVTGYLTPDGRVDEDLLRGVAEASGHRVTYHRAIERVVAGDPVEALHRHPAVDRILSGGGAGEWPDRVQRLEALQRAASPIVVIAGGGVDAAGAQLLAASPVVREVHVGRTVRAGGHVYGPVEAEAVRMMLARIARVGSVRPQPGPSARQSR
jgi:copper homeostasis protein